MGDRGYTPRELARLLRVSPDKVRGWILRGELSAINTASALCGKPRFVVLPEQLAAWQQERQAARPAQPQRRKRRTAGTIDYYPEEPG